MSEKPAIEQQDLFDFLVAEASQAFSGWDFSYLTLTGRMVDAPLPWSYISKILFQVRHAQSLLDMGTGGGELLSMLRPLPPTTWATEGYAPNIAIARQRLEPLGIRVHGFTDPQDPLPFVDDSFDLIINRHEYYRPDEVLRVLKPGQFFITQQVGGQNNKDLNQLFGSEPFPYARWTLEYALKELQDAGWQIVEQREAFPVTRFYDVGAIVYYLKAVPWQVPDFSVEKYFEQLIAIHNRIQQNDYLDIRAHRFLIVAQKPIK